MTETVYLSTEGQMINPNQAHVINGNQWPRRSLLKESVRNIAGVTTKQVTVPDYDPDTQEKPVQGSDGEYAQPVDLPFEQAKQNKLNSIKSRYEQEMQVVRGDATQSEVASWDKQEQQAREYQAWVDAGEVGTEPSTPFVDDLAAARGVTKDWIVGRIIAKATQASTYTATQTGVRQKLEDEIDDATTTAQVREITWPE